MCLFLEMIEFDEHIFFNWVAQPPTSMFGITTGLGIR